MTSKFLRFTLAPPEASGGPDAGDRAGVLWPENQFNGFALEACRHNPTPWRLSSNGNTRNCRRFLHLPLNAVFCRLWLSALQSGTDSATSLEFSGERNGRIAPSHDAASESA